MRAVFADTFFFLALLDSREQRHAEAIAASRNESLFLVTTEWILTEFADAYSDPKDLFVLENISRTKPRPSGLCP